MTPLKKPPIYRTKDYLIYKIFESGIVPGIALFNSREIEFTPKRKPLTLPETITKMENQGIDIKKDFKNFLEKIIDFEQLDKNRKTVSSLVAGPMIPVRPWGKPFSTPSLGPVNTRPSGTATGSARPCGA